MMLAPRLFDVIRCNDESGENGDEEDESESSGEGERE